jgi:predicted O-methyltransferase YrrM
MSSNIFDKPILLKKNEVELLKFLRANTNIDSGGTKLYDGQGTHSLQNPEELIWLIKIIQKLVKNKKLKLKNFLEFGYAWGFTNSILNKFFKFEKIISVDNINNEGQSKESFFANLRFKNFVLLCGDSRSKFIKDQIKLNSKYDLIFIDGGHEYDVVKNDFELAKKNRSKNSIIIFHDINATACKGPGKLWKQIKKDKSKNIKKFEYVCKNYKIQYGIGVLIYS